MFLNHNLPEVRKKILTFASKLLNESEKLNFFKYNQIIFDFPILYHAQLLLETFSPKMHVEQDIRIKLIFKFILWVKTSSSGSGGFNTLFRTSFSNIFHAQIFAGPFSKFSPHSDLICLDNLLNTPF